MITPNEIMNMADNSREIITEKAIPYIDRRLKRKATQLTQGDKEEIYLDNLIKDSFEIRDEEQIHFNYIKLKKGRMEIAENLAKQYENIGWITKVENSPTFGNEYSPVLIFKMPSKKHNPTGCDNNDGYC